MTEATVETLRGNITRLLTAVGDKGQCKGCGAEIWWLTHKNGRKGIYDPDGTSHFVTCPEATRFKRDGK